VGAPEVEDKTAGGEGVVLIDFGLRRSGFPSRISESPLAKKTKRCATPSREMGNFPMCSVGSRR
jgi:hypothetical protein